MKSDDVSFRLLREIHNRMSKTCAELMDLQITVGTMIEAIHDDQALLGGLQLAIENIQEGGQYKEKVNELYARLATKTFRETPEKCELCTSGGLSLLKRNATLEAIMQRLADFGISVAESDVAPRSTLMEEEEFGPVDTESTIQEHQPEVELTDANATALTTNKEWEWGSLAACHTCGRTTTCMYYINPWTAKHRPESTNPHSWWCRKCYMEALNQQS